MSSSAHTGGLVTGVDAAIPTDFVCRLSVAQYHQMLSTGILTEDDPVELLDGWLVAKMMKNPPHCVVTELLRKSLEEVVPAGWFVRLQDPITLATSEPEPDIAVVRGQLRDYLHRHPEAQEVAIVVEVADASLQRDQITKKHIYAQAGIPAYWIVNLPENRIEVYSDPSGPTKQPDYRQRRDYAAADEIPVLLEGRQVGGIKARTVLP